MSAQDHVCLAEATDAIAVESFERYFLHDLAHHAWDVTGSAAH